MSYQDIAAALDTRSRKVVCAVGDAFDDIISSVVLTRSAGDSYAAVPDKQSFQAMLGGDGNCAIEHVPTLRRMGGCTPATAFALANLEFDISAFLPVGDGSGVFAPLMEKCHVVSTGKPGQTLAFQLGGEKVMFNDRTSLNELTWGKNLFPHVARLDAALQDSDALLTANWAMLPGATQIWQQLATILQEQRLPRRRFWFVDIADPTARMADLPALFDTLKLMQRNADVVLSLNAPEMRMIKSILSPDAECGDTTDPMRNLQLYAEHLCEVLKLHAVICHSREGIGMGLPDGSSYGVPCFREENPVTTVGAGDNFLAGIAAGFLEGFKPDDILTLAAAQACCYVRTGRSPSREEIAFFLGSQ